MRCPKRDSKLGLCYREGSLVQYSWFGGIVTETLASRHCLYTRVSWCPDFCSPSLTWSTYLTVRMRIKMYECACTPSRPGLHAGRCCHHVTDPLPVTEFMSNKIRVYNWGTPRRLSSYQRSHGVYINRYDFYFMGCRVLRKNCIGAYSDLTRRWHSRYSNRLPARRPVFHSREGQEIFIFYCPYHPLGPTQPHIQWVQSALFPRRNAAATWSWPLTSI
jgi:hypothetical protein